MRCDTCHKEVVEVSRVVIYTGYNKMSAKAIYNCSDCFLKKEQSKPYNLPRTQSDDSTGRGKPSAEKNKPS